MRLLFIPLLLLNLIKFPLKAQSEIPFVDLESADWMEEQHILKGLDTLFDEKRIVGLGEATHGTSEFTIIRKKLIQYLVEKKGFNTFILEADYSGCIRINRYIHGESDDVIAALKEVQYWVWNTHEMVELIEWMRQYNTTHPENIQFIGCDMQSIYDDKLAIPRILQQDSNDVNAKLIFSEIQGKTNDTATLKTAYSRWNNFYTALDLSKYNDHEKKQWNLINQSLQHYFEHKFLDKRDYNYRDSCMAATINTYLYMYPNAKCVYFAHNAHVARFSAPFKRSFTFKSTGTFLNERWKNEYAAVGLTCGKGRFNAFTVLHDSMQIATIELPEIRKNTIEHRLTKIKSAVFLCKQSSIKNFNKLYSTEIGALYGKFSKNIQKGRFQSMKYRQYDYIIFIQETKESTLINRPKKKRLIQP